MDQRPFKFLRVTRQGVLIWTGGTSTGWYFDWGGGYIWGEGLGILFCSADWSMC